jgi:hypothetical protein
LFFLIFNKLWKDGDQRKWIDLGLEALTLRGILEESGFEEML